jgi:hypothetical protein
MMGVSCPFSCVVVVVVSVADEDKTVKDSKERVREKKRH